MPTFREKILELSALPSPNSVRNHLLSASSSGLLYYAETVEIEVVEIELEYQLVQIDIESLPAIDVSIASVPEEIEIQLEEIDIKLNTVENTICLS